MTFGRFAPAALGALLLGALASCGSSSAVSSGDGGPGGDTGVPPNGDAAADSDIGNPGPDAAADSDTGSPPSSDGGGDSAGGDGGACQLPPEGPAPNCFTAFPVVSSMIVSTGCMSGQTPQPQGGSIPDGIYDLVVRNEYGSMCPMDPTESATLVICAGQWDWVLIYDPDGGVGSGQPYAYNYAAAPGAGGSVALTSQCQSDLGHVNETLGYTYTSGGQLDIISTGLVSTYAKR